MIRSSFSPSIRDGERCTIVIEFMVAR